MKLSDIYRYDFPITGNCFGIELEIENFEVNGKLPENWYMKEDGSLRNGGREFVSDPLPFAEVEKNLTTIFSLLKLYEDSYSERTSIHVHCNVRDLTTDNIASMTLLYLVFEGIFFAYVDKSRRKNIFCVSLNQFQAADYLSSCFYKPNMENGLHWEKYSAFNLLPLQNLGTVEFRHMQGNNNVPYIMSWIEAINQLKTLSKQHTFNEWFDQVKLLNNTSEYFAFAKRLFDGAGEGLFRGLSYSDYKTLMYPGIMQAKLWEVLNQQKRDAELKSKIKRERKINPMTLTFDDVIADMQRFEVQTPPPAAPALTPNIVNAQRRVLRAEQVTINPDWFAQPAREIEGGFVQVNPPGPFGNRVR